MKAIGDTVKFRTKFGDTISGEIVDFKNVPWGTGEKKCYIVSSTEAFPELGAIHCIVPPDGIIE